MQTVLAAVGPPLRRPVLDRLVERGGLDRSTRRALGLFTSTTLRGGTTGRRAELVGRVRAVLVDGVAPDPRTAALAALLSASGWLVTLHREIPWTGPVITRAKALEKGDRGAAAAARTMAAVVTNPLAASARLTAGAGRTRRGRPENRPATLVARRCHGDDGEQSLATMPRAS